MDAEIDVFQQLLLVPDNLILVVSLASQCVSFKEELFYGVLGHLILNACQ